MKQYMWIVPSATARWTFLMIVKYDAMVSLLILRVLMVIINRCELLCTLKMTDYSFCVTLFLQRGKELIWCLNERKV